MPVLVEAAATVGAAQIQNRGTLGGNIANASPAGDMLPVLLATDAEIVVGSLRGERSIPAASFWTGYRRTALEPDEIVVRIRIPLVEDRHLRFRKVGHPAGPGDQQGRPGPGLGRRGRRRPVARGPPGPRLGRRAADPGRSHGRLARGPAAHIGYGRYGNRQGCRRDRADQ